jgi:hypothetical protein
VMGDSGVVGVDLVIHVLNIHTADLNVEWRGGGGVSGRM